MTLIWDERARAHGPGLHAFIVGVSDYDVLPGADDPDDADTFGMHQLTAAAGTAAAVARWLLESADRFPVPLMTVRLLLAPTDAERARDPELAARAGEATLDTFLQTAAEWRDDAAGHQENMTLFYFAGHGLQRTSETEVLVLRDFGSGAGSALRKTVTTSNLVAGMAPTQKFPDVARRQLYFVDACRDRPDAVSAAEIMQATNVFDVDEPLPDDRQAPQFYAAVPGNRAREQIGRSTLFGESLLICLRGAAGTREPRGSGWHVTVGSLGYAIKSAEKEARRKDRNITFDPRGALGDPSAPIVRLTERPSVDVTLLVHPGNAAESTIVAVRDGRNATVAVPVPLSPHPFRCRWPAGAYVVDAESPEGTRFPGEYREVLPPSWRYEVTVGE